MSASSSHSPSGRLNDWTGWFVIALLMAVPIPFASNRPVFWALWALVVASAATVYFIALARMRIEPRLPFRAFPFETAIFVAVAAAIAAQLLPLGSLLPLSLVLPDGSRLALTSATVAPGDTWFALLRWMTYGLLFVLVLQTSVQRKRTGLIARALVLIVAVEAVYALLALVVFGDTILVFEKFAYPGVATGTFVNRNSLATFLGIGAVVSMSQILKDFAQTRAGRGEWERRIAFLLAFGIIFAALLATQSRMGLFATCLGLLTVVLLQRPRLFLRPFSLLPILAVLAGLAMLYGDGLFERSLVLQRSVQERGELYRQILGMIADRPLLGYGAGSFKMAFPLFHAPTVDPAVTFDHAHSTYLALWSGLGVVAGSLPMILVAALCLGMARSIAADRASATEASAALGATVLIAVHSLVDFSLEMQAVAMLYTAVLALGAAKALHRRVAS